MYVHGCIDSCSHPYEDEAPNRRHEPQKPADVTVKVPGGSIVFYAGRANFVCFCSAHKDCQLSRRSTPNPDWPPQGRPLGLLMGYLLDPTVHGRDKRKKRQEQLLTPAARNRGRAALKLCPGSRALFKHERKKLTRDEPSEPELEP